MVEAGSTEQAPREFHRDECFRKWGHYLHADLERVVAGAVAGVGGAAGQVGVVISRAFCDDDIEYLTSALYIL